MCVKAQAREYEGVTNVPVSAQLGQLTCIYPVANMK